MFRGTQSLILILTLHAKQLKRFKYALDHALGHYNAHIAWQLIIQPVQTAVLIKLGANVL